MKRINFNIIAVDFDGTLWDTEKEKIIQKGKELTNKLFEDYHNFIVIYTARSWRRSEEIVAILRTNAVRFHALACEKIRANLYIDDLAEKFIENE